MSDFFSFDNKDSGKIPTTVILIITILTGLVGWWVAGGDSLSKRTEFSHTLLPQKELPELAPYSNSTLHLEFSEGLSKEIPLRFQSFFMSGDIVGMEPAGLVRDATGKPIQQWGLSADALPIRPGPVFLSGIDGSSILLPRGESPSGVQGNPLYLITHFEQTSWVASITPKGLPVLVGRDIPLAINLTLLDQDSITGMLKPLRLRNIDVSGIDGVWLPCASIRTPWNTHLGSEEFEPDAKWFEHRPFEAMNRFLGTQGRIAREGGANPYSYGFPFEITVDSDGETKIHKRYAMGRISLEMGLVMPDEKTVYLTDDGSDGVRLMFVADQPRDLSKGTLYAARWVQTSDEGAGRADLQWIRLGHGREDEVRQWIDQRLMFSDLFDWIEGTFYDLSTNPGYQPVYVYQGFHTKPRYLHRILKMYQDTRKVPQKKFPLNLVQANELDNKLIYLKIKPGRERAAAFLETRKYSALRGATTEFTKLEGQALNSRDRKLYTVASSVTQGMIDGNSGLRPQDHIRLQGNKNDLACGVIYESDLAADQEDSEGELIRSQWVAVNMKPLLSGKGKKLMGDNKACDPEAIAGPDNIVFSEKLRHLFIAEESGTRHVRSFLWAYSVDTGKLSRIMIAPRHTDISGLHIVDDINGFWYLLVNFQKDPDLGFLFFERDLESTNQLIKDGYIRGISGYLGPVSLQRP